MFLDEIFNLVIKLEGTLSGEHGIGIIKKQYIEKEINKNKVSKIFQEFKI